MKHHNLLGNKSWKAVKLVIPFFRQYKLRLACGFLALLGVDFLQLWIPRVIKKAVDGLEFGIATESSLFYHGLTIVLLALGIALLRFCWRYLVLGFSRQLEIDLRSWLFSHLLTLDRVFFQRHPTGEIMALATNDLTAVQMAGGIGLVACVDALVMSVAALAFMAYIHPLLTIITLAPMPVLAIVTRLLSAKLHNRFSRVQEQFAKLSELARTTLTTIRLIKAYTREPSQAKRFDDLGKNYIQSNLRLALIQGALFPASGLVGNFSMLLVVFFGGRLTIQGAITAGDFVAFTTYLYMLVWPMMAIGWVTNLFQRGVTSLGRIETVLHEIPILKDPQETVELPFCEGRISIKGLDFTYNTMTEPVLTSITLDIQPGVLGIVGRTGSGKSTLCQLLARQYPVPEEVLFFEGIDVNRMNLDDVRGCLAYVPQDVVLFSDTIAANIAFGSSGATQEQIESAAEKAVVHKEIMAMPEGYHTRIGEKGVKLSGGQRQRIALARALLLERPIIIIDDSLSAVDLQTEQKIIKSLSSYSEGRTCIIVSHRLAPLVEADEILVVDGGRIVDQGSHAQLLIKNAYYAAVFHHQTSAEDWTGAR